MKMQFNLNLGDSVYPMLDFDLLYPRERSRVYFCMTK